MYLRLSGMEGTLVTTLVLASTATLLNKRWAASGLLLGAVFWSRPELALYAAAAGGMGFFYWFVRWPQRRMFLDPLGVLTSSDPVQEFKALRFSGRELVDGLRQAAPVLYVVGIPAMALVFWALYNHAINGSFFPNTYLAKNDATLGLFPVDNLSIRWNRSFGDFQAWIDGWRVFPGVAFALVGAIVIARRFGLLGSGLVLFVPLLILAVGGGIRFGDAEFNFFARRYTDPAIPVLLMLTAIGGWFTVVTIRHIVMSRVQRFKRRWLSVLPTYFALAF